MALSASCADPEEAFSGDEVECLIERHDDWSEGAGRAPAITAPPQNLDVVALAGRPQARDRLAGAPAVERVAADRPHHLDPGTRPGMGGGPLAHRISTGHRDYLPRHGLPHPGAAAGGGVRHAGERARSVGRVDAAVRSLLHRRGLAPRAGAG